MLARTPKTKGKSLGGNNYAEVSAMNKIWTRLFLVAAMVTPFVAGCEKLEDKPIDQGKVDRMQDEIENSKGD